MKFQFCKLKNTVDYQQFYTIQFATLQMYKDAHTYKLMW